MTVSRARNSIWTLTLFSAVLVVLAAGQPAHAADPQCPSIIAAIRNAQTKISQLLPEYNAESQEAQLKDDAAFRSSLAGYTRSASVGMSTYGGGAQINENIRAATGRSIIQLMAAARGMEDAPGILSVFASAVNAYCSGPGATPEEAQRAIQRFQYDKDSFALENDQKEADATFIDVNKRSQFFETAVKQQKIEAITESLNKQQEKITEDLQSTGIEGAVTAAIGGIQALGKAGELVSEGLSHSKDWGAGLLAMTQQLEVGNKKNASAEERSLWAKGATDLLGGTMDLVKLTFAGIPEEVKERSAVYGAAELASGALLVGGIASWTIEQGLLNYQSSTVSRALDRTSDAVAANRELLHYQLHAARERLDLLNDKRTLLAGLKKELGIR